MRSHCRYAIEKRNYKRAVSILEALPMTLETEAMWNNLAQMALHDKFFMIAERCAGVGCSAHVGASDCAVATAFGGAGFASGGGARTYPSVAQSVRGTLGMGALRLQEREHCLRLALGIRLICSNDMRAEMSCRKAVSALIDLSRSTVAA